MGSTLWVLLYSNSGGIPHCAPNCSFNLRCRGVLHEGQECVCIMWDSKRFGWTIWLQNSIIRVPLGPQGWHHMAQYIPILYPRGTHGHNKANLAKCFTMQDDTTASHWNSSIKDGIIEGFVGGYHWKNCHWSTTKDPPKRGLSERGMEMGFVYTHGEGVHWMPPLPTQSMHATCPWEGHAVDMETAHKQLHVL